MTPLVDVAIVTYNHQPCIRQAVESVLEQKTDFPVRLIIGDDCSTDGTQEIVREYASQFLERFVPILHEQHLGIIHPDRIGLKVLGACTAKYVAMLDGDDYWTDPRKLQKQVEVLEQDAACAGCFHETEVRFENGELGEVYGRDAKNVMTAEDTFAACSPFHTSSFVFRRDCFVPPPWYWQVVSGDMAIFSIVAASGTLKKVNGIMSVYRKHSGGITSSSGVINSFHQKRIELIRLLDAYHNGKYARKAAAVIKVHERCIAGEQCTAIQRGGARAVAARLLGFAKAIFSSAR